MPITWKCATASQSSNGHPNASCTPCTATNGITMAMRTKRLSSRETSSTIQLIQMTHCSSLWFSSNINCILIKTHIMKTSDRFSCRNVFILRMKARQASHIIALLHFLLLQQMQLLLKLHITMHMLRTLLHILRIRSPLLITKQASLARSPSGKCQHLKPWHSNPMKKMSKKKEDWMIAC